MMVHQIPEPATERRGAVATWDDVREIALALPETTERAGANLDWRVKDKFFAWERPLRKTELKALGDAAPEGDILGVHVPDLGAKEALLAEGGPYFTTPHFDGYAMVLVVLAEIDRPALAELLEEAWLVRAPKKLAAAYLAGRG
jgi:hypothetical protein